jgi:hypothetical protein
MAKLYELNIDEVLSNLSLGTQYDIGGEGHCIIVEEKDLDDAICEIISNFGSLLNDSFEPCDDDEEEE